MLDRTVPTITLNDLAQRIDYEHHAVATALQSALGHAINAGLMLIAAKRQVEHGEWLLWLKAHCCVPARTASHYMRLAQKRKYLSDQNGNVLPISVHEAVERLKPLRQHPEPQGGPGDAEWGPYRPFGGWGRLAWGPFGAALQASIHITRLNPPRPVYLVKAVLAGKTPGLTAAALRGTIALLTRYADALEAAPPGITGKDQSE